jgi:haloalkane dehalogenase
MWSFVWRDIVTRLRRSYRVVALDFPGAGLTPGGRDDVDLPAFVDIADAWLDHLGVDDAVFVVHDLGGVVGVNLAARRPERVLGVVAANSFAWPPHLRSLRGMLRLMGSHTAIGVLGSLRVIPLLTRTSFGVGRHLDRRNRAAFYGPYRVSRRAARNFHRAMRSAVRSPELFATAERALEGELSSRPVLTIFGERNDPFGFTEIWRSHLTRPESHVVEGGNHFPMCDAPDEVASWIDDWHRRVVRSDVSDAASAAV